MPFQKLPYNKGQIYIPDFKDLPKKNPCRDCFECQWCSNDRCNRCLGLARKKKRNKKKPAR